MSSNNIIRLICLTLVSGSLAACGVISARLAKEPVKRVTALEVTQACDAPEEIEKRLTGAFLRQSSAAGATFVPVLISGRENANGLAPDFSLNDLAQTPAVEGTPAKVVQRRQDAAARERHGFGQAGRLPNVYDVSYTINQITFSGPLVAGTGAFINEVPTSGNTRFTGQVAIELTTQTDAGDTSTQRAVGRFAMLAGYGSARGGFTASGFDAALPFDTLNWSNLFLCGTRIVSSGKGNVTVRQGDGPALSPFKADRAPAAFNALFESSLLAATERPGPPQGFGGVFVIQSDNGTMTAVFLSDPQLDTEPEPTEGNDA